MGLIEIFSPCKVSVLLKYKPETFHRKDTTDDSVELKDMGRFRSPIPASQPCPTKESQLEKLIRKAEKNTKLRYKIDSILFFRGIPFDQVDFELGLNGKKTPTPYARVKGIGAVSALTWVLVAGEIANALAERGLGMFSVEAVPK